MPCRAGLRVLSAPEIAACPRGSVRLARRVQPLVTMLVRDVMSTRLAWIGSTDPLGEACKQMEAHGVRHLLVRGPHGELAGILSDRDVRLIQPSAIWDEREDVRDGLAVLRVDEAMTEVPLATIGPDAPLREAAASLLDRWISALPVLSRGEVVGIVSAADLLRVLAERQGAVEPLPRPGTHTPPARHLLGRLRRIVVAGFQPSGTPGSRHEVDELLSVPLELEIQFLHPSERTIRGLPCHRDLAGVPGPVDLVVVFPDGAADLERIAGEVLTKRVSVFWYAGETLPAHLLDLLEHGGVHVVVGHSLADAYAGVAKLGLATAG